MCNQENCPHENKEIIITDRDRKIGEALMATMFMRIINGTETNNDAADWMVQAGTCAIDCNEDCGTSRTMLAALTEAIDHVDNGADLPIVALYNKAGLLVDGKKPTMADRLGQMLKRAGIDLDQFPSADADDDVIDTIIVDTVPPLPSTPGEVGAPVGRMVGADRGRAPSILVGGPRRPTESLH